MIIHVLKLKCDGCGREVICEPDYEVNHNGDVPVWPKLWVRLVVSFRNGGAKHDKSKDLCDTCSEALRKLFKEW